MQTTLLSTPFKHQDKLQAIALAEHNSHNQNRRKSITVQHFNDGGHPDSPAEQVLCEAGHSPIAIQSLNGGYYVATENDPESIAQSAQNQNQSENQNRSQYAR